MDPQNFSLRFIIAICTSDSPEALLTQPQGFKILRSEKWEEAYSDLSHSPEQSRQKTTHLSHLSISLAGQFLYRSSQIADKFPQFSRIVSER